MTSPEASIIIPAYQSHNLIGACLEAIHRQTFRDFEIIVVDSAPDGQSAAVARRISPNAIVYHSPVRLLPHAARNEGAKLASGRILVHTDPDCRAHPDWLERLIQAHHSEHTVAGGSIANHAGIWPLAVHMAKFSWQLPGGRPGPRPDLATANVSYSREVWERLGPFLPDRFTGDSDFIWRVRSAGIEPWFVPEAVVEHQHVSNFPAFLRERFLRGRDFGEMRVHRQHWSRARCLAYLLAFPILPLVVFAYSTRFSFLSHHALTWLWTWPFQLIASIAWCMGEAGAHFQSAFPRAAPSAKDSST